MVVITKKPTIQTIVKTVGGECSVKIELDININLNQNELSISANHVEKKEENEATLWTIPDFDSAEILQFGKEEK
jgi:hypothetical protein